MSPYRSDAREAVLTKDPFRRPPKHPRITIYPATSKRPVKPDPTVPIVWGLTVAMIIVLVDALVR